MQLRFYWGLLYVLFCLLAFPPYGMTVEQSTQQLLNQLEQNSIRQMQLNESLWSKYLISEENLKQEKGLSLVLDQLLQKDTETILNLETSLSKQELQLTKVYSSLENLEEDLTKQSNQLKLYKYGAIGLGTTALVLGALLILK